MSVTCTTRSSFTSSVRVAAVEQALEVPGEVRGALARVVEEREQVEELEVAHVARDPARVDRPSREPPGGGPYGFAIRLMR